LLPNGTGRESEMSTANSRALDDVRVGVRLKISSLWIAMLFLFAYGDGTSSGSSSPGR
jgi:hypothetical protein